MPASPWPKSLEVAVNHVVAVNTNPFTAQQQTQDWQAEYREISVSLPSMTKTQASAWVTFLQAC
jgi:hypothetical protein